MKIKNIITASLSAVILGGFIATSANSGDRHHKPVPPRMVEGAYGTALYRAWNFYCKEVNGPRILRVIVNSPNAPQTTDPNAFHMYLQPDGIESLDEPFLARIASRCSEELGVEAGITGRNEVNVDWRR